MKNALDGLSGDGNQCSSTTLIDVGTNTPQNALLPPALPSSASLLLQRIVAASPLPPSLHSVSDLPTDTFLISPTHAKITLDFKSMIPWVTRFHVCFTDSAQNLHNALESSDHSQSERKHLKRLLAGFCGLLNAEAESRAQVELAVLEIERILGERVSVQFPDLENGLNQEERKFRRRLVNILRRLDNRVTLPDPTRRQLAMARSVATPVSTPWGFRHLGLHIDNDGAPIASC